MTAYSQTRDGLSEAATAVEHYNMRASRWPNSRFRPSKRAKAERDASLPGVMFYRYPDGSLIRKENGDLQPY